MTLDRRSFLRGAGVALGLPLLERFAPLAVAAEAEGVGPKRMMCVCTGLGIHGPDLFPSETGRGYASTPYLDVLAAHREQLTVISGLSHPGVDGGHSSEACFLTAAPHPASMSFRNSVSLDQFAAEQIGSQTRFATLNLSTHGGGLAWNRSGVRIPAETSPSRLFAKLFLDGTPAEKQQQRAKLSDGQSILDVVKDRAVRLQKNSSRCDRQTLDQYYTSIRCLEKDLVKAESWMERPKPCVKCPCPSDVRNGADIVARQKLMYDMTTMALQTDSTRIVTLMLSATNKVPTGLNVSTDWHNLSHHGKDPEKIDQLRIIEKAELGLFNGLLTDLAGVEERGASLLDRTMVLFGSNLGNASSHDTKNMPILLAGGGLDHGRHLAFDPENHPPLCDLYVHMLQHLGLEVDRFGSSASVMSEVG